jgi:RNA polymerase sigma factor (sigma-70 family)
MFDPEKSEAFDIISHSFAYDSDIEHGIVSDREDDDETLKDISGQTKKVLSKQVFAKEEDDLRAEEKSSLVQTYFKQMEQFSLLTSEEEKVLGKTIASVQNEILMTFRMTRMTMLSDLRKAVSDYLSNQKKGKEFPRSRQQLCFEVVCILGQIISRNADKMEDRATRAVINLFKKIERIYAKREYQEARERLINSNLRLVVRIALSHMRQGRELLDLVQDGNIGLMKAAEKFEYERGFKFSTYASRWIVQTMASGIAKKNRQIHLPLHVMEDIAKVMSAVEFLQKELGYSPDHEQISEKTGLPLLDVQRAFECLKMSFLSIDAPPNIHVKEDFSEIIADNNPLPFDHLVEFQRIEKINEALSILPNQRDAEILKLRFHDFTLDEIGGVFKRTRERIRQIEARMLNTLRKPRYRKLLEDL